MIKVGLTGGICTGKTTVGQMFVNRGCYLIDSDRIAHALLEPNQKVHSDVIDEFGDRIKDSDGRIDRALLGEIVFNDPTRRQKLNDLVHPAVIQRQSEFIEDVLAKDPSSVAIVDAALMIEVGTYTSYDRLIVVTCEAAQQKDRLKSRTGLPDEKIKARISSQMSLAEKVSYADFVIDNAGLLEETERQVEAVYGILREEV